MNNYESFRPIDNKVTKTGGTLFKRFFSKINRQEGILNQNQIDINEEQSTSAKKVDKQKTTEIDVLRHQSLTNIKGPATDNEVQYEESMSLTRLLKTFKSNVVTKVGSSENLQIKHKLNRVYWMPDSICHKCYFCEDEFTAIRRRHHCRMCGQIFCYRCCAFELPGSLWNQSKPQRSCHRCFQSFYTNSKRKFSNISPLNLSNQDTSSSQENRLSSSPTFSLGSENLLPLEKNLDSSNRNISFSSNDLSSNTVYGFSEHLSNQCINTDDFDTIKRNNSVPDLIISNCEANEIKIERKMSPGKLNPKSFIQSHILNKDIPFLRTITASKITHPTSSDSINNPKVQKEILLLVWKEIIEETQRLRNYYFNKVKMQRNTRSIENQFSFPNDEDYAEPDGLNVIFTSTVSSKSCIHGSSLVDWMVKQIKEVTDKSYAVAICQLYLEMQLIFPYFPQEGCKSFKDDNTMYVIRECNSDYSPRLANKDYDNSHFTDFELKGYLSSNSLQKSCGNSTFYGDADTKSDEFIIEEEEQLRLQYPSSFIHMNTENRLDASNDTFSHRFNTNLWNRSCEYMEKLLKQELRDYNLDVSWCNVILPICKMVSETVSPSISRARNTNDIRDYIHIKKVPDSLIPDCQIIYSISMSKNVDYPIMREVKNPNVILIRSSIDYWRHKKLVSLDPLLLQEEEYLKNCVKKILTLKPDIVVVEGNVSLIAKEIMEMRGLILISNVRKPQMDRLARMLGTTIFDSVDSLGANVESPLGRCIQFNVERFRLSNGRHKYLTFFKLLNHADGCTLLLRSKSLSELVRVKYITKFMVVAFRNAYLELACMKNFQFRSISCKSPSSPKLMHPNNNQVSDLSSDFMDIIESRTIAISPNVYYAAPIGVVRKVFNPDLQSRLLSHDVLNISWKEKLNDVVKRKQRHFYAELYDELRMKTRKHPLMHEPDVHAFLNCFHDRIFNNRDRNVLYSDFRKNGSRFMNVNKDIDSSLVSTLNFETSNLAMNGFFLTREQETRWRDFEKKRFESIWESFNPRNYRRLLLLYSIQTNAGICEKPRKISLSYYEASDKSLGNFVSTMLNDCSVCPLKCEASIFEHVHKFVHNGGCIEISIHQLESDSHRKLLNSAYSPDNAGTSDIKLWNWCSRCDKMLGLRDMSEDTWNLSLGRFFDLLFNMNSADVSLAPGQCSHSLQTDIHYYFTESSTSRALEIKYVVATVYDFQTPDLVININDNKSNEDLFRIFKVHQKEIEKVTEIKTKYNIEIKAKILKLKGESKIEDSDLWDFLKQDSNTEQYSETMEKMYNLMEQIYDPVNDNFNVDLFKKHQNLFNEEIIHLWIDIVNFVTKWDQKLSEAFEREEKEKRQYKLESKTTKSSSEDLLAEQDFILTKSTNNNLLDVVIQEMKDGSFKKTVSCVNDGSQESDEAKKKFLWTSFDDKYVQVPVYPKPDSRNESQSEVKPASHVEKSSGSSTASTITRKLFPSFFNTNNLKILDEPTSADCSYVFSDIWPISGPVVVKDDSITSVIAFALSSNVYSDKLKEIIQFNSFRPNAKSESSATICPPNETKISDIGSVDGFNNSNLFATDRQVLSKNPPIPLLMETITKDRDMCVRYLNRPESEDQYDMENLDAFKYECKMENEDIKIEVSTDESLFDDYSQRPVANSKVLSIVSKKIPKSDFEMTFSNHKAKCFCRIYNALQFQQLREDILGSDQQSYIRSLIECKDWTTTGGKSGLKFRKTMDDRYVIKQLSPMELNGFRKFHEKYFEYITNRVIKKQKCVLAKILGIYHVDYSNSVTKVSEKLDFLVMENLFFNQKPSRIFDLKGNKQIAVNVTAEKMNVSDTSVMQDKDFINYTRSKPIYVSWQTQIALKETLTSDTDFLKGLPVMDYSLLVGVDDINGVLVIGIIDYLRMFTIDKLIEMHFKQKLLTPHGELPTVIQPQRYQKRFLEAIEEYFQICPIPWDCLLLYPSNPHVNNNFNFNTAFPNSESKLSKKTTKPKRSFAKDFDENKLRFGLLESV